MKKIFQTHPSRLLLSLLFAIIGGGINAWGETYEQLTSIASIDESAKYVLGIDGTGFHYSGTSSWGKTALPSKQTPLYYTLTKAADGKSFTAKTTISGTEYYLQIPTSNTFSMETSAGTNTDIIIGTTQVSGTNYAVTNKTTTGRHLRINGSSGLRSYAGTTGTMAFFYKVIEEVPAYTITAQSNNNNYGTVSLSGSVITASPASGYTYADPAYTVSPANSATVAQNGNKFTVTPSENTTVTINFEAIPKYAVTIEEPTGGTLTVKKGEDELSSGDEVYTGTVLTIEVSPADRYNFTSWEAISGGSTNTYTESFSYTVESSVTIRANFTAKVYHNAIFSVNGNTYATVETEVGEAIAFPSTTPGNIDDKVFRGWVATPIDGTTNVEPTFVTSATMGENDVTYYAVFADVIPGTSELVNDVLTRATTGVANGANYSNWSGKTVTSSAVYAGNSAGSYDAIQLRSNNNNSGIVSTTSGGKVKKVTVEWQSNTASERELGVYVSNSPFETPEDLYPSLGANVKMLGRIKKGTDTEFEITGDYTYIGLRSESGAMYLSSVTITWETGTPDTYSGYCTTVVASSVAKPEISVAENFYFSTTATITCETEGATIYYNYDSEDSESWTEYTGDLTLTETKTIYAKAVKDEDESKVVSATATKNLAEPAVAINDSGITNKNLFVGTAAGSLSASVTYNETPVAGAVVKWSGDNDEVATINETTGAVTLVGEGSVTFTATFEENADYSEKAATYEMKVTNVDPDAYFAWVETDLASLTSSDVFVIVGNNGSNYAMANNNGTSGAPAAVEVTVVGKTLSGEIEDKLQWNISGDAEDGYMFYPNGDSENWLYCTNTNNGVRVGTNDDNKYFTVSDDGYLSNTATSRYVGIYNSQDWRCYTNTTGNIADQTFKFYKKAEAKSVTVTNVGYATYCSDKALDFEGTGITAYVGTAVGEKLTFTPITQVPANTGLLLVCAGGKTADVPVIASADAVADNCLTGVTEATTLTADDYILNVVGGQAGFFRAGNDHKNLKANRAYIPASVGAGVKSFALDLEDNADGIEETFSDSLLKSENIYNLAGQRLSKMQKGINIVNGKKVLK